MSLILALLAIAAAVYLWMELQKVTKVVKTLQGQLPGSAPGSKVPPQTVEDKINSATANHVARYHKGQQP